MRLLRSWFGRKQAALPLPKPEVVETATPLVIEAKTREIERQRTFDSCVYVLYVVGTRLALFLDRSWERDRE